MKIRFSEKLINSYSPLCLLFALIFSGSLRAEPANAIEPPFSSGVDFIKQTVTSFGLAGTPWETKHSYEEERARAWMDALHHAYEKIMDIRLMEGANIKDSVLLTPSLKMRLGQIILAGKRTFFEGDNSGLIRCKVVIPLSGVMSLRSALFLGALYPRRDPFTAKKTQAASQTAEFSRITTEASQISTDTGFLQVVIDVRGTSFEPSLFPRFFSENGELLFQESLLNHPHRFSRPLVRFSQDAWSPGDFDRSKFLFVDGYVPPLSRNDLKIFSSDEDVFRDFCRELEAEPLGRREILIIYGGELPKDGALPKAVPQSKEQAKGEKSPQEPARKRRR
ncbi:hypothetical protein HYY75_09945 [bacterium]|nr:hypothetical protein [bacterium]